MIRYICKTLSREMFMKKIFVFLFIILNGLLSSCTPEIEEEIILPGNDISSFTQTEGQKIPVMTVSAPLSTVLGTLDAFARYEKQEDEFPVVFKDSLIKSHQLVFNFDAIYPIDQIVFTNGKTPLTNVSIDLSFDGNNFNRKLQSYSLTENTTEIDLEGQRAKAVRFVFDTSKDYEIKDIYFTLALGVIVKENEAWTSSFLRMSGWTGADGIFAFDLDGNDEPGHDSKTAFVFSDTFIGEVYPHNYLRKSSTMINNSIGYYDPTKPMNEAFSFDWNEEGLVPKSIFKPDDYIGKRLSNLLDSDGLSISMDPNGKLTQSADGIQYLKSGNQADIIVDFKNTHEVKNIHIWNYNETPDYGATDYELFTSSDKETWTSVQTGTIDLASGNNHESVTLSLDVSLTTRYIKLTITNDQNQIGLGKLAFIDRNDLPLFGEVTGSETDLPLSTLDNTSRLWIQDGVVIGNYLYLYSILVKDWDTIFKVHNVGVIQVPIVNNELDHKNSIYHASPLQTETSNGTIFMGAGMMNHIDEDGYIYIYGYKDPGRYLVSGRYLPDDVINFNNYEYWNGTNYVKDIRQAAPIKELVSAELSVTYIKEGMFAGKYMLVVMENTTSGKISYALSDTPYGPFTPYEQIFRTYENQLFNSAFTYNAKMHPNLSEPGRWLITYNVNAQRVGDLANARIYYPRFIEMIEVKTKE